MSVRHGLRAHKSAHPKTWLVKKVLLSALVVGGLTSFTVAGTYATLNAESTNHTSAISSGTLALTNAVGTASACYSYLSSTNSKSCDPLVTSSTLQYPGGTAVVAHVTLTNVGSINASSLVLYMPSCSAVTSPGATSPGGGNPCTITSNGLAMFIQETDSDFSSNPHCRFPVNSSSACGSLVAGTFPFMAAKNSASSNFSLNEGLNSGQTRYFVVELQLPSAAPNSLQAEEASFNLTWLASQ